MKIRVLCIVLAVGLALVGGPIAQESSVAHAQVWSPKGKKKRKRKVTPAPKKAGKNKKKRKATRKRSRKRKKPAKRTKPKDDDESIVDEPISDDDDDELDTSVDVDEDGNPINPPKNKTGDDKSGDDDDDTSDDDDDDDKSGDDDDGDTATIDDDLDDVGAKVKFTKKDLASNAASPDGGASVTRLETLVMAFAQLGVDTVHDPAPEQSAGIGDNGEDIITFRAHARAEGTSRFGSKIKVKVAGRVNADLTIDSDTQVGVQRYETEIWDTYVDFYASHVDVRFGKQIVPWGVSDLLSPNDVVNARDLRRGFADRPDELRIPTLALSATLYDGPFSLQALWIPVAPTNRFELLDGDYALLGPNAPTQAERRVGGLVSALADDPMYGLAISPILDIDQAPDSSLNTGELGAALSLRFKRIDFHGYALWGHERSPRIVLADGLRDAITNTPAEMLTPELIATQIGALSQMGVSAVEVKYPRRMHIGGAIATRVEPVGFKVEAGYAFNGNTIIVAPGSGRLLAEPLALPQFGATASIDYDRGSDLTIVLEASHLRVFDVPSNRTVYQYKGDRLTLLGSRFQWNPRAGPVTLSFLGFVDVDSPSYILKPGVRLSGHDNLSVEIAGAIYGGPAGSFGGDAAHNDEVMLTVQYGL